MLKVDQRGRAEEDTEENRDSENSESEEEDEDIRRSDKRIPSPIRNDSETLRTQKEHFLNTFNDKRSVEDHNINNNRLTDERPFVGQPAVQGNQMQSVQMRNTS